MTDFIVVGTDTNAGKTTFSAMFLAAFPEYSYWKPVETGDSDTELIRRLVPSAKVHPPLASFKTAVSPALAAKLERKMMPGIDEVIANVPASPLLIETYGSPMSPWDDDTLQLELIRKLNRPIILISSSSVGAVGRTLQCIACLPVKPVAVVLLGERDDYAVSQIERHSGVRVVSLPWDGGNLEELQRIQTILLAGRASDGFTQDRRLRVRLTESVWHPYTSLSDPVDPLPVVHMQDELLTLADGRKVVDAISSWWTIQHGHRHPRLTAALQRATQHYDHVHFAGVTHEPATELAERLLRTTPWPDGKVFYSDNGSTAVEVALKMAYQYWCLNNQPERKKFICFENGYHGDTFGAMAVGRDPVFFGRFEPYLFEVIRIPLDADRLRDTLISQAATTAGVLIEPLVQGAGGMRMHSPDTLADIADLCEEFEVPLIVDEVMTGGGRTGRYWAHDHAEITPDIISAAKTIAGGMMPIAATLVSPKIVKTFQLAERKDTFFHGHSFTAHPLACAVGVENLKIMETGRWQTDVDRIDAFWEQSLSHLTTHDNVLDVRVCGTIAAIEIDVPGGYLSELGPKMRQKALEYGVLLRPLGNVIYAMPPFCTSEQSLAKIAEAMTACVNLQ